MNSSEVILGLPEYQVTNFRAVAGRVYVSARYIGAVVCPHCGSPDLWLKDKRVRRPRHDSLGLRQCVLEVESRKWWCRDCRRKFWDRLPGILPHKRATEPVPAQRLPKALRRDQRQLFEPARGYLRVDGGALDDRLSAEGSG